jgi:hypothetical protein
MVATNRRDLRLLHHRGECLLGRAARFKKARKIRAFAQFGDAQFDAACACLPDPVAVAIALNQAVLALLSVRGPCQPLDLELHQPLRGKADHVAQQIRVRGLLQKRPQAHHFVGHRWSPNQVVCRNPTLPGEPSMTDREAARSLRRY